MPRLNRQRLHASARLPLALPHRDRLRATDLIPELGVYGLLDFLDIALRIQSSSCGSSFSRKLDLMWHPPRPKRVQ